MVGSYSSMKWFWMSWIVKADLPTPPPPTMTSLYSVIEEELGECCRESEPFTLCNVFCNNYTQRVTTGVRSAKLRLRTLASPVKCRALELGGADYEPPRNWL